MFLEILGTESLRINYESGSLNCENLVGESSNVSGFASK